jgi:hypothetical protein
MENFTFEEFQNFLNENRNLYKKAHQDAVLKIACALLAKIKKLNLNLELNFQTRIVENDDNSARVDIILRERNATKIEMMIDVATEANNKLALERLRNIQQTNDNARNCEIFVFCYDSDSWYKSNISELFEDLSAL